MQKKKKKLQQVLGAGEKTKDHTIRFSDVEQKDKGTIENDFIYHFNPSFIHQISREPTNLSHCIWLSGEVQVWIQYGLWPQGKNRGWDKELCQLPASPPKDRSIYTLPGFVHSHLSSSPPAC